MKFNKVIQSLFPFYKNDISTDAHLKPLFLMKTKSPEQGAQIHSDNCSIEDQKGLNLNF